jgi:hypothetical protein
MSSFVRTSALAIVALTMIALSSAAESAAPPGQQQLPTAVLPPRTPVVPQAAVILALVRSTLLAVDHANKTGNYTVLRDLSGPDFHDANDAARLAQIFAPIRSQNIDMLGVAVLEPQYKEAPRLTAKRMLYVAGRFAMAPRAVNFELLFEVVRGQWRIYGISLVPG